MGTASDPRRFRRGVSSLLERLGLRPAALDYTAGGDVGADGEPGPVEVIVPIHGAHDEALACLASAVRHTDFTRHRLVLVIDGDPGLSDETLDPVIGQLCRREVLRHPQPRGFVVSVNRAMGLSERDVVLLNSDTLVTAGWLEKMQAAAYASPEIATVTPFSNHATICSLPRPLVANPLPEGHTVDSFAGLVERVARRSYPRIPTGVGMCLYLKRRALDRLGSFDEAAFGAGYGEETDFCLRALKAGFVHVLDDATFIFHHGERSFGSRRAARVRAAERTLARRHPAYVPTIAAFLRDDPLAEERRRVRWALRGGNARRGSGPRRVLHVVHGFPPANHAGTELYAAWLAGVQKGYREVAVYARVAAPGRPLGAAEEGDEDGVRVRRVTNNFDQRHPLSRNALRAPILERDLDRFLDQLRPELVHVHHLAGHGVGLLRRIARRRVPLVYQVQDWWALCARANRFHAERRLCPGPGLARCASCLPLTGLPPAGLWSRALHAYRRRLLRRGLRLPHAFVMGSRAIERDYLDAGLLRLGDRRYVLEYGIPRPASQPARPAPALPLRFGVIGAVMPHKGLHVAVAAFRDVDPRRAVLEVWGDPEVDPGYAAELRAAGDPAVVRFRGPFAEADKAAVFAGLDVLIVPSTGLESFGLVAREALAHGVPVIASRLGALADLFTAEREGGVLFTAGDDAELRRRIAGLVERPATVAEWRRRIPPVVSCEEHAEAIEQVYADVLEEREAER